MEHLRISSVDDDNDDDDLDFLDSPPPHPSRSHAPPTDPASSSNKHTQDDAHEAALQAELSTLRRINAVIEGVIASISRARTSMDVYCIPRHSL